MMKILGLTILTEKDRWRIRNAIFDKSYYESRLRCAVGLKEYFILNKMTNTLDCKENEIALNEYARRSVEASKIIDSVGRY